VSAFRRTLLFLSIALVVAYAGLSVAGGAILAEHILRRPLIPLDPSARPRAAALAHALGAQLDDVAVSAADATRLHGWMLTPARANGHTVVLLHSIFGTRAATLGPAERSLELGYRVLTVDARAHGDSGGGVPTFGALEAEDMRRWFRLAMGGPPEGGPYEGGPHEDACVYAMGSSLGAAHLLQAADAPELCGIVAQSGFVSLREITIDRIGQQIGVGPWLGRTVLRPGLESGFAYVRLRHGIRLDAASAAGPVAAPGAPILLIHGADDDNVPVRHAMAIRALNPARVELWVVPGAGHDSVARRAGQEYWPRIAGFLRAHRRMR
jgi:pimeloyl-ACP methyl ester carboxylesterase